MRANAPPTGGAVERLEYVKELMKYIKVDSYGHCLNNMKHAASRCVVC